MIKSGGIYQTSESCQAAAKIGVLHRATPTSATLIRDVVDVWYSENSQQNGTIMQKYAKVYVAMTSVIILSRTHKKLV